MKRLMSTLYGLCLCSQLFLGAAQAEEQQVVSVHELPNAPVLDGDGADWTEVPAVRIPLHNTVADSKIAITSVDLKAGVHGDSVYFYAVWADPTEDLMHKPFVWDENKGRYQKGTQREDRFAMQFVMNGEYDTNWLSGKEFTADMWHWKSSRTNPSGKADDKMTEISRKKLLRAYKGATDAGEPVYILRAWDEGDKTYTTRRYNKKQEDIMPKYILNPPGKGSSMDIDAKGVWKDGHWHLELRRKLDTGHGDDVKFTRGTDILGGIAVFERSQNDDHAISEVLVFRF